MSESTPKYELLVDGSPIDAGLVESIIVISVHKHLELADMLEVRIDNDDLAWTQGDTLVEGKQIAVKLGYEETGIELVFTGEITRRDCAFPMRGPATLTVVAYDKKHHLAKGRQSRTFTEMKDSDIVSQIAGDVGLSPEVDATETKHKYVFQQNKSNLAFLGELAQRVGYSLKIDAENKKLAFKKPDPDAPTATLTWGKNLRSFKPRMSTADQVNKVVVQGWDMTKKEKIKAEVTVSDIELKLNGSNLGADLAPAAKTLMPTTPLRDPGEAKPLAKSIINAAASKFCEGSGSCDGDPLIDTGGVIEIDGVGQRAGGQYFVQEVLHHLEPSVGYYTRFGVVRASETAQPAEREELPRELPPPEEVGGEGEYYINIRVRSETGESLEGISYTVTLPNGEQRQGTLDAEQRIFIDGIRDPGEAKIELDPGDELKALE